MADTNSAAAEAKKELTLQLTDTLTPHIYDGIKSIYDTCKDSPNVLMTFQEKLNAIPKWNQDIIDKEFERITSKKDFELLDQILEFLVRSHIKILEQLKVSNSNNTLDLKIPNQKTFIHKCYIETARAFWCDPYLMDDREIHFDHMQIRQNIKRSFIVITGCIEKTIRDFIPLKDILEKYSKMFEESDHSDIDKLEDEIEKMSDNGDENYHTDDHTDDNLKIGGTMESNGNEDPDNNLDNNLFMSEPAQNFEENNNQQNGNPYNNNHQNSNPYNNFGVNNNEQNGEQSPNLIVSSGQDISETPTISEYNNSNNNNSNSQFIPQYPGSRVETENKNYTANVRTEPNGIKNIMIQKANNSNNNNFVDHTDDPFFSDDEN